MLLGPRLSSVRCGLLVHLFCLSGTHYGTPCPILEICCHITMVAERGLSPSIIRRCHSDVTALERHLERAGARGGPLTSFVWHGGAAAGVGVAS